MPKPKMLSIGDISAITGVHISSLRYYDRIGALKPAYIDPRTNYRYYTSLQLGIVQTIQACVELDIPLKKYLDFTDNDGHMIYSEQLLQYGKAQAQKKIRSIKDGLRMIDMLQDAIAHSKRFTNPGESIVYDVPRKRYFTAPMEAPLDEDAFISLDRMYSVLMKQGCKTGYETGFLYIYRAGRIERYQCIEVVSIPRGNSQNIMTIPAGHYRAIVAEGGAIERTESIFPDLFGTEDVKYALETELLTEEADMDHLVFELRCSVSSVI